MKNKYTISFIELMKNPLTSNDIRKLDKLTTDFLRKEKKLGKIMLWTCPLVIIALTFIGLSLLNQSIINNLETSMKISFFVAAITAVIAAGVIINLSIYAIYSEIKRPFNFVYKKEFRGADVNANMNVYEGMFADEKSFDLTTINSTELTKNFYEKITTEKNRPITVVEYDIIKYLHKKVS
jgi:small-conductance mechanosensitive channel